MKLNDKTGEILVKHLSDYRDTAIITSMIIGSILMDGINHYKNMSDEDAAVVIAKDAARREELKNSDSKTIPLTTPELFKDMLETKRDLCKNCNIDEIENLIVYCNRSYNTEKSETDELLTTLVEMLSESNAFTDAEISERTGLEPEEFEELTGWSLDI